MSENQEKLQEELVKIEQTIAAQEALRGVLPDEQIDNIMASLQAQRALTLATLSGSGAIAQADSVAAGEGGTAVLGDVHGPIIHGNRNIIGDQAQVVQQFGRESRPATPDPAAELELLQEQLQAQKLLLASYRKQLVLASGSEAAKLEVQIGQLEQDIRGVEHRIDELQANKSVNR